MVLIWLCPSLANTLLVNVIHRRVNAYKHVKQIQAKGFADASEFPAQSRLSVTRSGGKRNEKKMNVCLLLTSTCYLGVTGFQICKSTFMVVGRRLPCCWLLLP